ncbi:MAG: hypothetical protein K6L73_07350 [Cellvibrionaceae bacterium]
MYDKHYRILQNGNSKTIKELLSFLYLASPMRIYKRSTGNTILGNIETWAKVNQECIPGDGSSYYDEFRRNISAIRRFRDGDIDSSWDTVISKSVPFNICRSIYMPTLFQAFDDIYKENIYSNGINSSIMKKEFLYCKNVYDFNLKSIYKPAIKRCLNPDDRRYRSGTIISRETFMCLMADHEKKIKDVVTCTSAMLKLRHTVKPDLINEACKYIDLPNQDACQLINSSSK